MPHVRFSRDKRGYEHIYLVQASNQRGHAGPARILYWYRTPPGVKVGRQPFDETVRRALEAEYPNLAFDWKRIVNTPMPPPETENWRERRRAERAMRQARAADDEDPEASQEGDEREVSAPVEAQNDVQSSAAAASPEASSLETSAEANGEQPRRRRRRGGRRRRMPGAPAPVGSADAAGQPSPVVGEAGTVDTLDPHDEE